jgi:hypothetical protein
MQVRIGQLRILWERLMTLVYYLEQGKEPDGKSVRKQFFRRLTSWNERWDVLVGWEAFIDEYDTRFRTPEYHKRSSMRNELFGRLSTPYDSRRGVR